MKIDKILPLPPNTKLRWIECFAKLVIEKYSSNNISDLNIIDKPDLQNLVNEIGIEVTSAANKEDQEMDNLYSLLDYNLVKNSRKVINKIETLGGKISNGILIHPGRYRDLNKIYESLSNKLDKLNGKNYKKFKTNSIIIFDDNLILNKEYNQIINKFNDISSRYKVKFNVIYLYIYGYKFIEFDLDNNKIYEVIPENIYELSNKAREMVIQAES